MPPRLLPLSCPCSSLTSGTPSTQSGKEGTCVTAGLTVAHSPGEETLVFVWTCPVDWGWKHPMLWGEGGRAQVGKGRGRGRGKGICADNGGGIEKRDTFRTLFGAINATKPFFPFFCIFRVLLLFSFLILHYSPDSSIPSHPTHPSASYCRCLCLPPFSGRHSASLRPLLTGNSCSEFVPDPSRSPSVPRFGLAGLTEDDRAEGKRKKKPPKAYLASKKETASS